MSIRILRCVAVVALACACGEKNSRTETTAQAPAAPNAPSKVAEIGGLMTPESARYDESLDVWFISNINGVPSEKDGNGFITRVRGDRSVVDTMFVRSGANGATLNAPKGLALTGDTLWVADIDAVRAFDARTGAAITTIDLSKQGAVFLNDIAVGPDGALYITDTGIRIAKSGMTHPGPDRIFRVQGGAVTEALKFLKAVGPNGITFDHEHGRFFVVPFAANALLRWTAGGATIDTAATGPGGYDGVEILADGRVLVSSWNDSTVRVLDGTQFTPFIRGVAGPADIGIDTTRGLVAIPIFDGGRVELWTIPAR
jgi:hypothetical protein